jgi:hypothetical protein
VTLDLAKSILVLVIWPAAVLAIAWMVTSSPLGRRVDEFLFDHRHDGGGRQ